MLVKGQSMIAAVRRSSFDNVHQLKSLSTEHTRACTQKKSPKVIHKTKLSRNVAIDLFMPTSDYHHTVSFRR
jgi:hypothetical protein